MVQSPDISRQTFAEMANDELNFRESIKDPIAAETKRVDTDTSGENLSTPTGSTLPELFLDNRRCQPGMHIDWDIKILHGLPKDIVLRLIVKEHLLTIGSTGLNYHELV